jgi:hypothetical protein
MAAAGGADVMKVLLYSIAQNGYAYCFRPCLRSQRDYAERYGYRYAAVSRPLRVPDPALSAWLKVPLMLRSLEAGYDRVMFVDADCEIRRAAPGISEVSLGDESLHMAVGRSGRLNSGVIVARRDPDAIRFLERTMDSITEEISEADRADLKYENGNLIHCARTLGGVAPLDPRWNNTQDPAAVDYIRHFTGPMRTAYRPPPFADRVIRAIRRTITNPTAQPPHRSARFREELERLSAAVTERYEALASAA